ncbi:hypothetical protein SRABI02_01783 [Plantibacter cousiniae]|nr:hypothetical protein SRABI02_01783 [Plantibacter cousiniae]
MLRRPVHHLHGTGAADAAHARPGDTDPRGLHRLQHRLSGRNLDGPLRPRALDGERRVRQVGAGLRLEPLEVQPAVLGQRLGLVREGVREPARPAGRHVGARLESREEAGQVEPAALRADVDPHVVAQGFEFRRERDVLPRAHRVDERPVGVARGQPPSHREQRRDPDAGSEQQVPLRVREREQVPGWPDEHLPTDLEEVVDVVRGTPRVLLPQDGDPVPELVRRITAERVLPFVAGDELQVDVRSGVPRREPATFRIGEHDADDRRCLAHDVLNDERGHARAIAHQYRLWFPTATASSMASPTSVLRPDMLAQIRPALGTSAASSCISASHSPPRRSARPQCR